MTLETWKSLFEWGGVVLLALTFCFGAGALIVNSRIGELQSEKLRQFDKELTAAKTDLETQQERAAKAERQLFELQDKARARHMSEDQIVAIERALRGLPVHEVDIYVVIGTWDGTTFGLELASALNRAGWAATVLGQESSGGELRGIALVSKDPSLPAPGTQQLQKALSDAGILAPIWRHPAWGNPKISLFIAPRQ
jgi:hypothetical protein